METDLPPNIELQDKGAGRERGRPNFFFLLSKIFLHLLSLTIRFSPCQGLSYLLLRWPPGMHFLLLSLERFVFSGSFERGGGEWVAACADAQQEEMLHPGLGSGKWHCELPF